MIRRLRIKFVCINMAAVTMMLLIIFGMVLHFTGRDLQEQSERALKVAMEGNTTQFRPAGEAQLPFFLVHINRYGEVIATSDGYYDLSDREMVMELILLAHSADSLTGTLDSYHMRFRKQATSFGERIAFVDISSQRATMRDLVKNCCLIGLIGLALFLELSFLLARWAVRPVEKAFNQQRQFVADASHELKTPLTVIMTNAELLQDPAYAPEERSRFAGSILTMSRQMRGLVESLLELARVDNGRSGMDFAPVDLSSLANDAVLPFEPVYFERGLTLESQIEENLRVRGSAAHLRQVLEILLDNGAKYSSADAPVRLELRRQGSHCLLSLYSPGQPMDREELNAIFRRFYRADKARAMDGSYGLGLSIAESILAEHGGRIWAESTADGNTFFVQLALIS